MFLALSAFSERFSLHTPARYISKTGDGHAQIIIPLALSLLMTPTVAKQFLSVVIAAFFIERLLYTLLKKNLKRRRPPQFFPSFQSVIEASDEFSFPSGHTCAAFLLLELCSSVFPVLLAPMLVWAILVGCSRVALGVHFPADIIAGATLGFLIGKTAIAFLSLGVIN